MPDTMTIERIREARGAPVYDAAGEKIGSVDEIFYDNDSSRPEWVGLGTGFFATKRVLVPLEGARLADDGLHVPYPSDLVKDAPDIDSNEISAQTEEELYAHYQLRGRAGAAGDTDDYSKMSERDESDSEKLTRAEEELRVGKRTVETGGVRLRKWVETEPVDVDVELKRETARVRREPVDGVVAAGVHGGSLRGFS